MQVSLESPDQVEAQQLLAELDAHLSTWDPAPLQPPLPPAALRQAHVLFALARGADGQALGCAAVVLGDLHGEVRRMYVRPSARGQGVAQALLACLEAHALDAGCKRLVLTAGAQQEAALRLYRRCGFEPRGPFGPYTATSHQVFLERRL